MLVLFISLRGRHTFTSLSPYGAYCEKAIRLQYEQVFDFQSFNQELIQSCGTGKYIIAFDPCYLPKSGKHTYGVDTFWSGCVGKTAKGIEIAGIGIGDIKAHTVLHWQAVQTPTYQVLKQRKQSLLEYYAQVIIDRKEALQAFSRFQLEFVYRDAKQFTDLAHCQARSQNKIDFHVNLSLTVVSVAKAVHHLSLPIKQRASFSLLDMQTLEFNDLLLNRFIARFAIDTNLEINKQAYLNLLNFGRLAA